MLDSVEGPVHHLSYERGEDVIVMKGYKFAKAKTAAAATLGCLALANPTVAAYLVQVHFPPPPPSPPPTFVHPHSIPLPCILHIPTVLQPCSSSAFPSLLFLGGCFRG